MFTFTQSTPSTNWVINHGLGSAVATDVITAVNAENVKILPYDVEHASDNQLIILFSQPTTGEARVVGKYVPPTVPGARIGPIVNGMI